MANLIINVLPEFNWLPWKFTRVPKDYWNEFQNQRKFVDSIAKQLNIQKMTDWYKVSYNVILIIGQNNFKGFNSNWRQIYIKNIQSLTITVAI